MGYQFTETFVDFRHPKHTALPQSRGEADNNQKEAPVSASARIEHAEAVGAHSSFSADPLRLRQTLSKERRKYQHQINSLVRRAAAARECGNIERSQRLMRQACEIVGSHQDLELSVEPLKNFLNLEVSPQSV